MSWISNLTPPGIKRIFTRRETPDNLWIKCPNCGEMLFQSDLSANQNVCTNCGHHMRLGAAARFPHLFDDGIYQDLPPPETPFDPLRFRDEKRYADRLKDARRKTGALDSVIAAEGRIADRAAVAFGHNFEFMGGSLGVGAGEAIVAAALRAHETNAALIGFTAAGGARMQEGAFALMQMPRTVIAVQTLRDAGLPYIVVLTDPTTGGVTASYAMLGDVHLAEPGALIGFAGPRVIEQTIGEKLPEGFQRAEYLYEHGMVDAVVQRHELRAVIARILRHLMPFAEKPEPAPRPDPIDEPDATGEPNGEPTAV